MRTSAFAVGAILALAACSRGPSKEEAKFNPYSLKEEAPATYKVKFETTKGPFVVEVTRAWAPYGADRFYNVVKSGFFSDARFFRVVHGFVVQFGLSGKPELDQAWQEAVIPDDPPRESNRPGTITFAKGGPNSRTTQVFINLADNSRLDSQGFPPFGRVIEGMDVVNSLYKGYGDAPPGGIGPDQGRIRAEGNEYLERQFPRLDSIKSATIQ